MAGTVLGWAGKVDCHHSLIFRLLHYIFACGGMLPCAKHPTRYRVGSGRGGYNRYSVSLCEVDGGGGVCCWERLAFPFGIGGTYPTLPRAIGYTSAMDYPSSILMAASYSVPSSNKSAV